MRLTIFICLLACLKNAESSDIESSNSTIRGTDEVITNILKDAFPSSILLVTICGFINLKEFVNLLRKV